MTQDVKSKLIYLAQKYENSSFLNDDPSQFLRHYPLKEISNVETASFITALLSFGNRKQFIPKIKGILLTADKKGGIANYIKTGDFSDFTNGVDLQKKFYRFYSYKDIIDLFLRLREILQNNKTFGEFIKTSYKNDEPLCLTISKEFENCKIVPKGRNSANKRINMFLRWMIRQNSPVDLGLWKWTSPADLIIPLDTHVLQQSKILGLITQNEGASLKTAQKITEELKQIWPNDPCKGDFALFGLGIDKPA